MKIIKDLFDSTILNQDVYKIFIKNYSDEKSIISLLNKIRQGLVCCFTPCLIKYIRILEKHQFNFISIRNTYRLDEYFERKEIKYLLPNGYSLRSFSKTDSISDENIGSLANTIFVFSRYCKDTEIQKNKSFNIYREWLNNSLFNGYANQSIVAWFNNMVIGICTVKIKDESAYIDLLGVIFEHQKKHIGTLLLQEAIKYIYEQNIHNICVITEGENIKANVFYQRNGFIIEKVDLVYHKHVHSVKS